MAFTTKLTALYLFAGFICSLAAMPATDMVVTKIAEGRRNPSSPSLPAKLHGVITTFSGWKNSFFLQDATGGISIDRLEDTKALPGDEVEVTGHFRPGRFAPIFISDHTEVLRHGHLPKARVSTYTELSQGRFDSTRVEVSGIVHAAHIGEIWGKQVLFLDLHTPEGIITVHLLGYPKGNIDYWVDSTIQVKGVCGTIFNNRQQLLGLRLFVADANDIVVEKPALDAARLSVSPLRSLMTFDGPSLQHRVKVTGIVTYQASANELYLQEDGMAIRVQSSTPVRCRAGMRLNAWGFVGNSGPLTLKHATVEELSIQKSPEPTRIGAADAIKTEDGFTQAPYNGLLVQVEGKVLERLPNAQNQLWAIRAGEIQFQAQLGGNNRERDDAIEPGSLVSVTGICVAETDENQTLKSFRILLRSAKDVRVLNAPNWGSSLLLLLAIPLLILLGSSGIWFSYWSSREPSSDDRGYDAVYSGRTFNYAFRVLAAIAGLAGGLVLMGWGLNIRVLQLYPPYSAPVPNEMLAIVAAGIGLLLAHSKDKWFATMTCTFCTGAATATAALTLLEYITHRDFRIDQLLIRDLNTVSDSLNPGRMALATTICLLLIGCSIILLRCKRFVGLSQVLAIVVGLISLLNLIDFLYGNELHYGLGGRATMALPGAVCSLLLSLSVLLARSDRGLMKTICASETGGLMARRMIPVALVAPILVGWIRLQLGGFYDARFGLALFALTTIVCFGFVIWTAAAVQNRSDKSRFRAERALRERDQELEMIFDRALMGDYSWDLLNDEVTAHPVVWRLYGAPDRHGSAPADWFRSRHHPEDAAAVENALKNAIATHLPLDVEFRVIQPDRMERWVACRGTAVYDSSGGLLQVKGIISDITYRKVIEKQIEESGALCRHLADAMPQMVWRATRDGSIDYCNQGWYEYTGSQCESPWEESIHPDDLDSWENVWTGSLVAGSPLQIEIRLKRACDGSYRWHLVRAVPFGKAIGQIEHWFGTATDIDDSKLASAELLALNESLERRVQERSRQLEESERRHRLLVEGIQDYAIFLLDAEGRIATWNIGAERIELYRSSEVLGQHFSIFCTPEAIASAHPQLELELAVADGQYREEGWRVRKGGSVFWASVLITPIHDAEGKVSGFSKVVRDLTEQRRAEQLLISEQKRAEEANRAKSSFLAAMSHEIRTPMNAILGMADLLWETDLSAIQRQYVGRFRRAGTILLALINDILDLSKIESGRFELESVDFDLPDLVERTMELMHPRALTKNIELTTRVSPGTPAAFIGDPGRLQQILNNVVGNAIKFTERGSVALTVKSHPDSRPGHLEFAVSDTGIGIPADKLTAIFDDFTQAESSTTRRFGGTGLGLGICRRLVNRMGGDLRAESVLGQGSKFVFDVVLSVSERTAAGETREVVDFTGRRVLVIDNSPENRLIMTEACTGWGMTVAAASTGIEACELVGQAQHSRNPFSLVILDTILPDSGGREVLKRILELDPTLPIIMTSCDGQPGDMTRAMALGAAAFVAKPVRRPELLSVISSALRGNPENHTGESGGLAQSADKNQMEGGSMKVLIAEDSEDNRFLISAYLRNRPYELTFVRDGREALETFASRYFDLVLMDIQMPVMDGLVATASIRALERDRSARSIPILALSANALLEDSERSQAAGCNGHLSKPISKEKLIAAIENFRYVSSTPQSHQANANGQGAKYVIEIPEGFETLSRNYLASRRKEISRLKDLPSGQGLNELRVFGHNMKGTGVSFGFPELTRFGAAIQEAAKACDTIRLADNLHEADEYVEYALATL